MKISSEEKKVILKIARNAIISIFDKSSKSNVEFSQHSILLSQKGAFVTLSKNNRLRGCIGYIISNMPLYETIQDAAKQAAIGDPRFEKLSKEELLQIEIEVSILSEPFKMNSYDDIVVGTHGLILSENGRRGLLLPQVPIEHNMNKEEYLSALCEKAGLYSELWKEKVLSIEMFTADVFSEKELLNGKN